MTTQSIHSNIIHTNCIYSDEKKLEKTVHLANYFVYAKNIRATFLQQAIDKKILNEEAFVCEQLNFPPLNNKAVRLIYQDLFRFFTIPIDSVNYDISWGVILKNFFSKIKKNKTPIDEPCFTGGNIYYVLFHLDDGYISDLLKKLNLVLDNRDIQSLAKQAYLKPPDKDLKFRILNETLERKDFDEIYRVFVETIVDCLQENAKKDSDLFTKLYQQVLHKPNNFLDLGFTRLKTIDIKGSNFQAIIARARRDFVFWLDSFYLPLEKLIESGPDINLTPASYSNYGLQAIFDHLLGIVRCENFTMLDYKAWFRLISWMTKGMSSGTKGQEEYLFKLAYTSVMQKGSERYVKEINDWLVQHHPNDGIATFCYLFNCAMLMLQRTESEGLCDLLFNSFKHLPSRSDNHLEKNSLLPSIEINNQGQKIIYSMAELLHDGMPFSPVHSLFILALFYNVSREKENPDFTIDVDHHEFNQPIYKFSVENTDGFVSIQTPVDPVCALRTLLQWKNENLKEWNVIESKLFSWFHKLLPLKIFEPITEQFTYRMLAMNIFPKDLALEFQQAFYDSSFLINYLGLIFIEDNYPFLSCESSSVAVSDFNEMELLECKKQLIVSLLKKYHVDANKLSILLLQSQSGLVDKHVACQIMSTIEATILTHNTQVEQLLTILKKHDDQAEYFEQLIASITHLKSIIKEDNLQYSNIFLRFSDLFIIQISQIDKVESGIENKKRIGQVVLFLSRYLIHNAKKDEFKKICRQLLIKKIFSNEDIIGLLFAISKSINPEFVILLSEFINNIEKLPEKFYKNRDEFIFKVYLQRIQNGESLPIYQEKVRGLCFFYDSQYSYKLNCELINALIKTKNYPEAVDEIKKGKFEDESICENFLLSLEKESHPWINDNLQKLSVTLIKDSKVSKKFIFNWVFSSYIINLKNDLDIEILEKFIQILSELNSDQSQVELQSFANNISHFIDIANCKIAKSKILFCIEKVLPFFTEKSPLPNARQLVKKIVQEKYKLSLTKTTCRFFIWTITHMCSDCSIVELNQLIAYMHEKNILDLSEFNDCYQLLHGLYAIGHNNEEYKHNLVNLIRFFFNKFMFTSCTLDQQPSLLQWLSILQQEHPVSSLAAFEKISTLQEINVYIKSAVVEVLKDLIVQSKHLEVGSFLQSTHLFDLGDESCLQELFTLYAENFKENHFLIFKKLIAKYSFLLANDSFFLNITKIVLKNNPIFTWPFLQFITDNQLLLVIPNQNWELGFESLMITEDPLLEKFIKNGYIDDFFSSKDVHYFKSFSFLTSGLFRISTRSKKNKRRQLLLDCKAIFEYLSLQSDFQYRIRVDGEITDKQIDQWLRVGTVYQPININADKLNFEEIKTLLLNKDIYIEINYTEIKKTLEGMIAELNYYFLQYPDETIRAFSGVSILSNKKCTINFWKQQVRVINLLASPDYINLFSTYSDLLNMAQINNIKIDYYKSINYLLSLIKNPCQVFISNSDVLYFQSQQNTSNHFIQIISLLKCAFLDFNFLQHPKKWTLLLDIIVTMDDPKFPIEFRMQYADELSQLVEQKKDLLDYSSSQEEYIIFVLKCYEQLVNKTNVSMIVKYIYKTQDVIRENFFCNQKIFETTFYLAVKICEVSVKKCHQVLKIILNILSFKDGLNQPQIELCYRKNCDMLVTCFFIMNLEKTEGINVITGCLFEVIYQILNHLFDFPHEDKLIQIGYHIAQLKNHTERVGNESFKIKIQDLYNRLISDKKFIPDQLKLKNVLIKITSNLKKSLLNVDFNLLIETLHKNELLFFKESPQTYCLYFCSLCDELSRVKENLEMVIVSIKSINPKLLSLDFEIDEINLIRRDLRVFLYKSVLNIITKLKPGHKLLNDFMDLIFSLMEVDKKSNIFSKDPKIFLNIIQITMQISIKINYCKNDFVSIISSFFCKNLKENIPIKYSIALANYWRDYDEFADNSDITVINDLPRLDINHLTNNFISATLKK